MCFSSVDISTSFVNLILLYKLFLSVRSFSVKVDPRGLPHGVHYAEVIV